MPLENLNGLSSVFIAGYIAAVVYQGNAQALFDALKSETGYLEFAIAMAALWYMSKSDMFGGIVKALIITAVIAASLKMISGKNTDMFKEFASGQRGLFSTLGAFIGVND